MVAAVLRGQPSGDFQKTLADSLAFAGTLEGADLQRTNLRMAFLGPARGANADRGVWSPLNLSKADLFRADLSHASLRDAHASGTIFVEARMEGTVLRGADLRGANFRNASMRGADLRGACLRGAQFDGADLSGAKVDEADLRAGLFRRARVQPDAPDAACRPLAPVVFLSKPGVVSEAQRRWLVMAEGLISDAGFALSKLDPEDYPSSGALAEVARRIRACHGAIVLGLPDIEVQKGAWRPDTPASGNLDRRWLATPWSHVEAGMAIGLGLPVLLLADDDIRDGVFAPAIEGEQVWAASLRRSPLAEMAADWSEAVRRQAGAVTRA